MSTVMNTRAELMANRMKYLQTLLKSLRAEVSTDELIQNQKLLQLVKRMEFQLKNMEQAYVGKSHCK